MLISTYNLVYTNTIMKKILVVVESPGKIKKIQDILGPKYEVIASVGHIIDLDPKNMSIDIANNFEPKYITIARQAKTVTNLKKKFKTYARIHEFNDIRESLFILGL